MSLGTSALKIALICPAPAQMDPWMKRLAEQICLAPGLQLSVLIQPSVPGTNRTAFGPWWRIEEKLAARAVAAVCPGFDALESQLPILQTSDSDGISASALDIIIDLTSRRGQDVDSNLSRYGIWSLDFLGDVRGASSVAAILKLDRLIEIALMERDTDHPHPQTFATATLNTKFIAARNHLYICEKSVTLIMRELARLRQFGRPSRDKIAPDSAPRSSGIVSGLQYGAQLVRNVMVRVLEKLGTKLGLRPGFFYLQTAEGDPLEIDPNAMTMHAVPGNSYYADPFLWTSGGEMFCFFEVYDYGTGHGHLSAGKIVDGVLTDVRQIIKNEYHMSFPFLFEHEGVLYMLPETCGANRIETWKCVAFPYEWERHQTVLDNVVAADSSIVEINDEWWLFTNISTDVFGEMNSELHVFKISDPLMKTLEPHPLNPVVFDARTARNGGRVFEKDGSLYRASQRNSHGLYGFGLNLMRIDDLSMSGYEETLVRRIDGSFREGVIGCHHLDSRDGVTVIDVRKRIGGRPKN